MFMVYIWPFAAPGWRTVRSRWRRSLPGSSVSWAVSNQSSLSSMTPTLVFLRSSATNSALQQSMLGTLSHPSGWLLSDPSCHCSDSKLQVASNKVFGVFFFAVFFHNELLQHAESLKNTTFTSIYSTLLWSLWAIFKCSIISSTFTYLSHFLSFFRSSASPLPACESGWRRQRLPGSSLCPDWSNGGLGSSGQNTLQPISAFPANRDNQKFRAGLSEWGEQFQWQDSNVCALHSVPNI